MSLSPREERVLATLEEQLRADDPRLAATLAAPPSSAARRPFRFAVAVPVSTGSLLHLVVALLALAASTLFAHRLGAAGLALVTAVAVLPWLVLTVRAGSSATPGRASATRRWFGVRPGVLAVGAGLLLLVVAVTPTALLAVVGLVVTLIVAPWVALRVLMWLDRGTKH